MEMIFGVVADSANKAAGDKLNILGVFHKIVSTQFPTNQGMAIVMEFRAEAAEKGRKFEVFTTLRAPDGQRVIGKGASGSPVYGLGASITIHEISTEAETIVPVILTARNAFFPIPGRYHLEIFLDKKPVGQIPIELILKPLVNKD